jgi:hypothetical protein
MKNLKVVTMYHPLIIFSTKEGEAMPTLLDGKALTQDIGADN